MCLSCLYSQEYILVLFIFQRIFKMLYLSFLCIFRKSLALTTHQVPRLDSFIQFTHSLEYILESIQGSIQYILGSILVPVLESMRGYILGSILGCIQESIHESILGSSQEQSHTREEDVLCYLVTLFYS